MAGGLAPTALTTPTRLRRTSGAPPLSRQESEFSDTGEDDRSVQNLMIRTPRDRGSHMISARVY
jgi:hypothetical protein